MLLVNMQLPPSLIPEELTRPKRSNRKDTDVVTPDPAPEEVPVELDPPEQVITVKESDPTEAEEDNARGVAEEGEDVTVVLTASDLERKKTLRELRKMCEDAKLSAKGTKSELAHRLQSV